MKATSMLKTFAVASVALLFLSSSACKKENSSDVNQDKIYAEYELFYDANAGKTYASAVFKFSNAWGTNLQLSSNSSVKFGNDVIPYDPIFGYYRKEYSGMVTSGNFQFTDSIGTVYNNSVSIPSAIAVAAPDTIHKSSAYTYTWNGAAVGSNEFVGLTVANTANAIYFKYFVQYTVGGTTLILPTTELNYLPNGPATVSIVRQRETNATSVTSAGGKVRGKYKALNGTAYIAN